MSMIPQNVITRNTIIDSTENSIYDITHNLHDGKYQFTS